MGIAEKIGSIPEFVRLDRAFFSLPFTYIGMLAGAVPTLGQFALITVALISARSAAFAANRIIGREYDLKNPKKKAWASVRLYSMADMYALFAVFGAILIACAYLLNPLAFLLSPLVLLVMWMEPYIKRYTPHRHLIMGLVIGLGIFGGYIGVNGAFPGALALYVLWLGYGFFSGGSDILPMLTTMESDKRNGLKTYPTEYGAKRSLKYFKYMHDISALLFVAFGVLEASLAVLAGAFVSYIILLMENMQVDRSKGDAAINAAFLYYNVAVSAVMLAAFCAFRFLGI